MIWRLRDGNRNLKVDLLQLQFSVKKKLKVEGIYRIVSEPFFLEG